MKTKLNNPPKYLNVDEFNKLIKNSTLIKLRKNSLKSIYIHLAVVLGLHAGLRVSEMIKLKPKDVTLDAEFQNITIVNSKYNRTRIVPIMDTPLISLLKYLNVEDNTNLNIPYINRSTRQLYNLIEKVYKLSNIEYGGIHQLRHTYARRCISLGGLKIPDVQYLLGHSSTSTTRRYIDAEFSSNTSYIKEAFKKMKQFNDNNY
tara:strand:- start:3442 stop:4050 length:609 start_codon:yes stop_codon:yes gene_type:complete